MSKRTTTTREYNSEGQLERETVEVEENYETCHLQHYPAPYPYWQWQFPIQPQPQPVITYRANISSAREW